MPTYEYKCDSCGNVFEKFQSMNDEPVTSCEKCGQSVRKLFNNAGIIFKGSGFYVNDYKGSGASSSAPVKESAPCSSCSTGSCAGTE